VKRSVNPYTDYYIQQQVALALNTDPVIRTYYRAFHRFGQAKFHDGGLVLGSQLPPKTMLSLIEVKIDSKISNSLG